MNSNRTEQRENSQPEANEMELMKVIIIVLVVVTLLLFPIKIVILNDVFDYLKGDKLTDWLLTIFTAITVWYTYSQYRGYRKRIKAEVLGQYNERYSRDEHLNKVVDYIIHYIDNNVVNPLPSVHDAEMFMRFFEEMEIQIKENRMDEQQVKQLFSFYAIKLGEDECIRKELGIVDYDNSDNWEGFKSFVERMKRIDNTFERREQKHERTLSIKYFYEKVIGNPSLWKYYDFETSFNSYKDLYDIPDELIKKFLFVSEKIRSDNLSNCFKILEGNEHNASDLELNGRLRHIVSLFFWGHLLYQNIPAIKINVNQQFQQFIDSRMFKNENNTDNNQQLFSFMWFLLCIFHDFGYAYEKGLIQGKKVLTDLDKPEIFSPDIYSKEMIEKYAKYRKCAFGCNDHGVFGGKVFYQEMLDIGRQIAVDHHAGKIFKTDNVEKIYQYAAWVISCHNIFYNKGNDKYTNCYKCQGLECFINPKARCLSLKKNPLLFLFCFADSIEPTKTLRSKLCDKGMDYEISESLHLCFDNNIMKFDLSHIKCPEARNKYLKNVMSLNDWLIDVSEDLIIKFE